MLKKGFKFAIFILISFIISITAFGSMNYLGFRNGSIEMQFEDTKATTGTTYKTIGWLMHKESQSNMDAYNKEPVGIMVGEDFEETRSEDLGSTVRTTFIISDSTVDFALAAAEIGGIKDGDTIYLDSIFEVYKNGVGQGRYYYTYNDIKNAASWGSGTIQDLKSYYNIKMQYQSKETHPLFKEIKVNGTTISKEKITQSKTGVVHNVKLDETIQYKGRDAHINKSYFYYELQKGKKLFEVSVPDTRVTNRNATMYAGGITVVGEYLINPLVTVQHYDIDNKKMLEQETPHEVEPKTTVVAKSKSFTPKGYIYSEISEDNGITWKLRSEQSTRNIIVNQDTIIRFNYTENTDLIANLKITASPSAIENGKTDTVEFTLDAGDSIAKYGIAKYEFWFNGINKFEDTPDFNSVKSVIQTSRKEVKPNSMWYGKVRVTDKKGNTAIANAQVKIEELIPAPAAEINPNLKLKVVQDTDAIGKWNDDYNYGYGVYSGIEQDGVKLWYGGDKYYLDVLVDEDDKDANGKYRQQSFRFILDADLSESTNGISNYIFKNELEDKIIQSGGNSITMPFEVKLPQTPQDVVDGRFSNDYSDSTIMFTVELTDSVVTSEKARLDVYLEYRYIMNQEPNVKLNIDKKDFALGESAIFTPEFIENDQTYKINNKYWEILNSDGEVLEQGTGNIIEKYKILLSEGKYRARQYISFRNSAGEDKTKFAEVEFNVYKISPPDVFITSDKLKYRVPATGIFTVTYKEDPKFNYQIVDKDWKFIAYNGQIISSGSGEFPIEYLFTDKLSTGYYDAEQTIYWWEKGEYKSKTAKCTIKLISPVPAIDFEVSMKTKTPDTWSSITKGQLDGKEFRQIRIDLAPSIDANFDEDFNIDLDFTNPNTQIKVIPLDDDEDNDISKNAFINSDNASQISFDDEGFITTKGRQYIDFRFDKPGKYKVKCKVKSMTGYESEWLEKIIEIKEDLKPIVELQFENVVENNGIRKVFRNEDDLHVRFNVVANYKSLDDDTIDYDKSKLNIRFDYNANNDTADDGIHSKMYFKKNDNNLQDYITITNNDIMTDLEFDMYSDNFNMLGKMYFDYEVYDKPNYPYFIGGDLPKMNDVKGDTSDTPTEDKILYLDNTEGIIELDTGNESKIEIVIIKGQDSNTFNYNKIIDLYKDKAFISIIDVNGNKQVID